jgi:P27 family predicted phage terminase small subunit
MIGGNAGHRALPKDEPKPEIQIPEMPDTLSEGARPYWNDYGKKLAGMRVLSEVDTQALALLCEATATYWQMNAKVREQGVIVKLGKTGAIGYNPHFNAMNKAAEQMRQLLTEFGLTPSSRTRVRVE